MAELLLYINGQLADLDPAQHIAQTKQINDLNSLSNRQSNYTNKFRLPKTANNLKIFSFLSVPGNNSTAPYQQNRCSLYSKSGECFVYNGSAHITDGGNYFSVVLYDGIIDLQKVIENKTFSDIDISELDHVKNVDVVTQSWLNVDSPYRYILTDYGGNTGDTGTGNINIDYLVPSVSVSYLWDKIQQELNLNFEGVVFETEYFQNLWMTFPKGISADAGAPVVYECSDNNFVSHNSNFYVQCNSAETNEFEFSDNEQYHLRIPSTGLYRLDISGNIATTSFIGSVPLRFFVGRNTEGIAADNVNAYNNTIINSNISSNADFSLSPFFITLNANDTLAILIDSASSYPFSINSDNSDFTVVMTQLNPADINFTEGLSDFSIKDFLKEIVHRFGLTMVKNSYSGAYRFYTLSEQLQVAPTTDWSEKFISAENEEYVYRSYAQQNFFRYQYEDDKSDYNDSFIGIENLNIKNSRDIIKSKVYSPEQRTIRYLNENHNKYKLWDKEIDNDGGVNYKSLDKRFYFMRAEYANYDALNFDNPFTVYSDTLS